MTEGEGKGKLKEERKKEEKKKEKGKRNQRGEKNGRVSAFRFVHLIEIFHLTKWTNKINWPTD